MTRLTPLTSRDLDPEQRALYDEITGGHRADLPIALTDGDGGLNGPFNAMLLNPAIGQGMQHLGSALRQASKLPARSREIAILLTAEHWASEFELYAHRRIAASVGLQPAELEALAAGDLSGFPPEERHVGEVCRELLRDRDLSDDRYAAAVEKLGAPALFELSTLVGYYSLLAMQLRLFDVHAPTPD